MYGLLCVCANTASSARHGDAMHVGQVSALVAGLAECFLADVTDKWPDAVVHLQDVFFQVQLVLDYFSTRGALQQAKQGDGQCRQVSRQAGAGGARAQRNDWLLR